jgi:hypothetical protein
LCASIKISSGVRKAGNQTGIQGSVHDGQRWPRAYNDEVATLLVAILTEALEQRVPPITAIAPIKATTSTLGNACARVTCSARASDHAFGLLAIATPVGHFELFCTDAHTGPLRARKHHGRPRALGPARPFPFPGLLRARKDQGRPRALGLARLCPFTPKARQSLA